jgi:hypothetical protein
MKRRVIDPMRTAACVGVLVMSSLVLGPTADAATARVDLKDARGKSVGYGSLRDTPEGVKVTATFTDLPPGEHAFRAQRGALRAAVRVGRQPLQSDASAARP